MRSRGLDPDALFSEIVEADGSCIQGLRREGLTLAIHLCRGNNRSHWLSEGSYEAIAERLFNTLDVDVFLLEYDNDRSGGFEPLRFVPRGKTVVLGLITTKQGYLESMDALRRRIDEASQYVPMDDLAISPQCGFASVDAGNAISWMIKGASWSWSQRRPASLGDEHCLISIVFNGSALTAMARWLIGRPGSRTP